MGNPQSGPCHTAGCTVSTTVLDGSVQKKFEKIRTFRISVQVRNSLIFRVEPEHTGMQVACHADQCTDDIWLEMNARPED
jgi:hypothetical protein